MIMAEGVRRARRDVTSVARYAEHGTAPGSATPRGHQSEYPEQPGHEADYALVRGLRRHRSAFWNVLARAARDERSPIRGDAIGREVGHASVGCPTHGADIQRARIRQARRRTAQRARRSGLDFQRVGATENILMAAVLGKGSHR